MNPTQSNETLQQRYDRDPSAVIQAVELAARRERSRVIRELLATAVAWLFGRRRGSPAQSVPGRTREARAAPHLRVGPTQCTDSGK